MKKYQISEKKVKEFNRMLQTLKRIDKDYLTVNQLIKECDIEGLNSEEQISMAYENIKEEAKFASKGVRFIEIQPEGEIGTIKLM